MNIKETTKIGKALKARGAIRAWKESPGDFTLACVAARYYAAKDGARKIVVPGNSYGHRVFNVTNEDADLRTFTVVSTEVTVGVVYPNGDVFQAIATPNAMAKP